jgi:hypothetical protein
MGYDFFLIRDRHFTTASDRKHGLPDSDDSIVDFNMDSLGTFLSNPGVGNCCDCLQKPTAQVVRYASLSAIIGSTLVARRAGR